MHKTYWILDHDKNKDFRWQHVAEDPFKNWEQSRLPDMKAEMELDMALRCLYADDKDLGQQYLRRAITVADRALREEKCRSERCRSGYPRNEAELKRTLAYARALSGELLDSQLLSEASGQLASHCDQTRKRDWDEMDQERLITAARLALISGAREQAASFLKTKRSLAANVEEKELLQFLAHPGGHAERMALAKGFTQLFEKVRDPEYKPPTPTSPIFHRLDLGALFDKYFVSGDGEIDWTRVVEAVSE